MEDAKGREGTDDAAESGEIGLDQNNHQYHHTEKKD